MRIRSLIALSFVLTFLVGFTKSSFAQYQRMAIPKGTFSVGPLGGKTIPAFCLDYTRPQPALNKSYQYVLTPENVQVTLGNQRPVSLSQAINQGKVSVLGNGTYSSLEFVNHTSQPVVIKAKNNIVMGYEREAAPDVSQFNLQFHNPSRQAELARHIWVETDKKRLDTLSKIGYYNGALDQGIFPSTKNSIRRFQRNHGLSPNGNFDLMTEAKMKEVFASRSTLEHVNRRNAGTFVLLDGEFPADAQRDGLTCLFDGIGTSLFQGQGHGRMAQAVIQRLRGTDAKTVYIRFDSANWARLDALEKSLNLQLAQQLPGAKACVMSRNQVSVLLDSSTKFSPDGVSEIQKVVQGEFIGQYAFSCKVSHPTRPRGISNSIFYYYSRSRETLHKFRNQLLATVKQARYRMSSARLTNRIHAELKNLDPEYSRESVKIYVQNQLGRRNFCHMEMIEVNRGRLTWAYQNQRFRHLVN